MDKRFARGVLDGPEHEGWTYFCGCGEPIPKARWEAGYHICFGCGDVAAEKETKAKSQRAVSLYGKGPVQYGGDSDQFRKNLLDAGRKTAQITQEGDRHLRRTVEVVRPAPNLAKPADHFRRTAIGFYKKDGERVIYFEGDPRPSGVTIYPLLPS